MIKYPMKIRNIFGEICFDIKVDDKQLLTIESLTGLRGEAAVYKFITTGMIEFIDLSDQKTFDDYCLRLQRKLK